MKKLFKFLLGAGAVIAAIGGALYFLKNVLMKDYLEDYDDDDFDNDLYEEDDAEDRDYVTINVPDKNSEDSEDSDETDSEDNTETEDDLSAFDSVTDQFTKKTVPDIFPAPLFCFYGANALKNSVLSSFVSRYIICTTKKDGNNEHQ